MDMNQEVQQIQELTSYGDVNKMYDDHFDDRPFDNFEKKLFNKKISKEELDSPIYNNANNIYSITNYYSSVEKDEVQQLKYIQKLLKFPNENRGYLKLASYFNDKKDDEKMMACFKAGASKGNVHCMSNIGSILVQQGKYDEAIMYYKKAMEMGYYKCCIDICSCYIMKNEPENIYQYALYGALKEQQDCLDIIILLIKNPLNIFHVLTKLDKTSTIIQNYLNKVRPTLTENEINFVMTTNVFLINQDNNNALLLNIDGNVITNLKKSGEESPEIIDELIAEEIRKIFQIQPRNEEEPK